MVWWISLTFAASKKVGQLHSHHADKLSNAHANGIYVNAEYIHTVSWVISTSKRVHQLCTLSGSHHYNRTGFGFSVFRQLGTPLASRALPAFRHSDSIWASTRGTKYKGGVALPRPTRHRTWCNPKPKVAHVLLKYTRADAGSQLHEPRVRCYYAVIQAYRLSNIPTSIAGVKLTALQR